MIYRTSRGVGFKRALFDLAVIVAAVVIPPLVATWVLMLVLGNAAHAGVIAIAPGFSVVFGIFSPVYATILVISFVVKILR